jgi:TetR/AcrR family transcriptional regulator
LILLENTEAKILAAAEQIFLRDGFGGSRMQDIADLAEINKAMLHYYFRSKENLFEKIFEKNAAVLFPEIEELINSEKSFIEVINIFTEKYINMLRANPFLPLFIFSTVNNPEKQDFIEKIPYHLNQKFAVKYFEDFKKGNLNEIDPHQFIMSLLGMCIFPFIAKPIIKKAGNINENAYNEFINNRIIEIKKYVSLILIQK